MVGCDVLDLFDSGSDLSNGLSDEDLFEVT